MDKKTLGKKRQNLVSNDDIYIKYLTLFQNMRKPKFHLFNKQKSEIEQNELFYKYFMNQYINPNISFIINEEKKMIIHYKKETFVFSVQYLFESIYFPRIEIKNILSQEEKKYITKFLNSIKENFDVVISGFKISKIYFPSNSLFNFLSLIKFDSKILLLSNKFQESENLICIESKLINNNLFNCDFIICRIHKSLLDSNIFSLNK